MSTARTKTSSPKSDFDEEDMQLVNIGAKDLVYIERASEIFRSYMMEGDNIEKLLICIMESNFDAVPVRSETFPEKRNKEYIKLVEEYREGIENISKNISNKNVVCGGIVSVDLGEAGGHYNAFIYNPANGRVEIFDSMTQTYKEGFYQSYFNKLFTDIFGKNVKLDRKIQCLKKNVEFSLQETGGFWENSTTILDKMVECKIITKKERDVLKQQNTESQNHFCYMWSLWYIHLRLEGYELSDVVEKILKNKKYDTLFVIKTYIWNIANLPVKDGGFLKSLENKDVFVEWFPKVWSMNNSFMERMDCEKVKNLNKVHSTFELDFSKKASSLRECLKLSFEAKIKY